MEIKGCKFPEEVFYDVENLMWVIFEEENIVKSGLTDVGQFVAGSLLYVRPRNVGTFIERGKRVAIIESGKYVGPIRSPLSGELIEVNEAVLKDATLVNKDPYGAGWIFRLRPSALEKEKGFLLKGEEAKDALLKKMEKEGFDCIQKRGVQA